MSQSMVKEQALDATIDAVFDAAGHQPDLRPRDQWSDRYRRVRRQS